MGMCQERVTSMLSLDQTGLDALGLRSQRTSSSRLPGQQPGQHCEDNIAGRGKNLQSTMPVKRDMVFPIFKQRYIT